MAIRIIVRDLLLTGRRIERGDQFHARVASRSTVKAWLSSSIAARSRTFTMRTRCAVSIIRKPDAGARSQDPPPRRGRHRSLTSFRCRHPRYSPSPPALPAGGEWIRTSSSGASGEADAILKSVTPSRRVQSFLELRNLLGRDLVALVTPPVELSTTFLDTARHSERQVRT